VAEFLKWTKVQRSSQDLLAYSAQGINHRKLDPALQDAAERQYDIRECQKN
jgi:hypothetical protein